MASSSNNESVTIVSLLSMNGSICLLLNHDLQHLVALINLISMLFLQSIIVILALENNRSSAAAINGIASRSKAMILRFGYVFRCVGLSHHALALLVLTIGAEQYCLYSS